jgi:glycosyltransferase involved in cell wall biosynthesis
MKISACIPYYNRADMVMETLRPLLADDRVDEIIICDDCSPQVDFNRLLRNTQSLDKIKLVRNVENHHNQHNKRNALSFAKNEWVLLIDNDNVAGRDMLDKFFDIAGESANGGGTDAPSGASLRSDIIYHPAFASPHYDYRKFNAQLITKHNVLDFCGHDIFVTLCNTNNYFVNRDEYLRIYQYNKSVRGADGIYYTYNWLKAGNKIQIVPDMQYFHRVHEGSEFLRERESNMKLIYYWLDQLKQINQ